VWFNRKNIEKRFGHIADFAAKNDVDVILLQESSGGAFTGTCNSARDLQLIIKDKHNLSYNLRCGIKHASVKQLPRATEFKEGGEVEQKILSFKRKLQIAHLEIPGRGKINIYNTHLCSRCSIGERKEQVKKLLKHINKQEAKMHGDQTSILGGDFNSDRFDNEGAENCIWEEVITDGFVDTYSEFVIENSNGQETLDTLCEDEDNADEHCTVGVSKLDKGKNARRVDYVFARHSEEIKVRAARVVFNDKVNNGEPPVSDHAGIFISLELP
jgi:maltose 6'-phosphate phosphatase